MNQVKDYGRDFPPCGYGLLGLCCSDCLLGPCRISPFEKERDRGVCGADADHLVVRNLLRLTLTEGALALKSLREATRRFREWERSQEALEETAGMEGQRIAETYGLPGKGSGKELVRFLEGEATKLLDPLQEKTGSLFSFLFPEKVFPLLYAKTLPWGSLAAQNLDLLAPPGKEGDPEESLWSCLRASLLISVAEQIIQDLSSLLGPSPIRAEEREATRKILKGLPDIPVPILILVSKMPERLPGCFDQWTSKAQREAPAGTRVIPIRRMAEIGPVGKNLHKRWTLPVTDLAMMALVESPFLSDTLGSLALGLTTASFPPLPIQGSEKATGFFSLGLQRALGNQYLAVEGETASSIIFQFLKEKKP